jgi:hypothetical protein
MRAVVPLASGRTIRTLLLLVVVGVVGAARVRAHNDCEMTYDCDNVKDASVCVDGECVPCDEDPGQCQNGYGLADGFCNSDNERCEECSDCGGSGCNPDWNECNSGGCSGYDCGYDRICNDNYTCDESCSDTWDWQCQDEGSCGPPCM